MRTTQLFDPCVRICFVCIRQRQQTHSFSMLKQSIMFWHPGGIDLPWLRLRHYRQLTAATCTWQHCLRRTALAAHKLCRWASNAHARVAEADAADDAGSCVSCGHMCKRSCGRGWCAACVHMVAGTTSGRDVGIRGHLICRLHSDSSLKQWQQHKVAPLKLQSP